VYEWVSGDEVKIVPASPEAIKLAVLNMER
jgi:hypothetical protein